MTPKEKILRCLQESEIDLSIQEIANKTGIHRDTVSKWIEVLLSEGKVIETRKVGKARLFKAR